MVDTTFIEKINLIFNLLKDNSIISLILILLAIIIMDLLYGRNSKKIKILYTIIIILLLTYTIFSYYKPFLNIFDVYITNIFKITYFPSIIDYISFILITIIIQIISWNKGNKFIKTVNLWVGIVIEALFIVNLLALNNISVDLSNITSIYENNLLLSIFQISSIIFIIWVIFNILTQIITYFIKDRIEMPKLNNEYE